jgi:hypothetical protein
VLEQIYTSGTLAIHLGHSITNANRAVGQVNIADDTSNDWYITGVQLEAGTTASDFEFLPVDVNLGRCQRYYEKKKTTTNYGRYASGLAYGSTSAQYIFYYSLKRATPTVSYDTAGNFMALNASGSGLLVTLITSFYADLFSVDVFIDVSSGLTAGNGSILASNNNTNSFIEINSEL